MLQSQKENWLYFRFIFGNIFCANVEGTHLDNISLYLDHYIDLYLLCTYKNTYISTTIQHIYI